MKIWLDTTVLDFVSKEQLQQLVKSGNTLAIANTVVDVKVFQDNPEWVEYLLSKGKLVIEMWLTLDQMVAKPFYWSSRGIETSAAPSFLDAIASLPEPDGILDMAVLVDKYSIPKGSWKMGPYSAPAPLPLEDAEHLGISVHSTRTEILKAAKERDKMYLYDAFNRGYCRGLAIQHCCNAILNTDGTVTEIKL